MGTPYKGALAKPPARHRPYWQSRGDRATGTSGLFLGGLSDDYVFSHVFSTHEVMEERRKIQEPGIFGIHVDRRIADSGE